MNTKKLKKVPLFQSEDEERDFWGTHDSTEYIDYSKTVEFDFSQLKPSTQTITLRMPRHLLESIKAIANRNDVPYQSLMKVYLAQKVDEENYLADSGKMSYRRNEARLIKKIKLNRKKKK